MDGNEEIRTYYSDIEIILYESIIIDLPAIALPLEPVHRGNGHYE